MNFQEMTVKTKVLALSAALVLIGISTGANAGSVYATPENQGATLGGMVEVMLWWDFSGDATFGGGTDIAWDSAVLSLVSVQFDANPSFDPLLTRSGDVSGGLINGLATGTFDGLGGMGPMLVATITFEAVGFGTSLITLSQNVWPAGPFVSTNTFVAQNVDFTGASINVVPLPAAVWLMIGGLGVLLRFRRRDK